MVLERKSIPIVAWAGEKEKKRKQWLLYLQKVEKSTRVYAAYLVSVVKAVVHEACDKRSLAHWNCEGREGERERERERV